MSIESDLRRILIHSRAKKGSFVMRYNEYNSLWVLEIETKLGRNDVYETVDESLAVAAKEMLGALDSHKEG